MKAARSTSGSWLVKGLVLLVLAAFIFGGAAYAYYVLYGRKKEAMKLEQAMPPPPPLPDPSLPDYEHCLAMEMQAKPLEMRAAWRDFLDRNPRSSKVDEAREKLGRLNMALFLSPIETPEKTVYEVKRNDVITRVAAKNDSTPELIMRSNNLSRDMLRIGQRLVIPPADFSLRLDLKRHRVELLQGGKFFKQYAMLVVPTPAAGGSERHGKATPRPGKITGRVTGKVAWHGEQRVIFTDKGFLDSDHWIEISPGGHSLYTEAPEVPGVPRLQKPPGGGYGLAPDAMQELSATLRKGDPVVIE